MSWPTFCKHCLSKDIQVGIHEILCLACGCLTDAAGHAVPLSTQYTSDEVRTEIKK